MRRALDLLRDEIQGSWCRSSGAAAPGVRRLRGPEPLCPRCSAPCNGHD